MNVLASLILTYNLCTQKTNLYPQNAKQCLHNVQNATLCKKSRILRVQINVLTSLNCTTNLCTQNTN